MAKRKKKKDSIVAPMSTGEGPRAYGSAAYGTVTYGSGNVFADIGFEDAEELQVKAGLTHQICDRIQALALTQIQAAAQLGISQPDVSKLMKGRYTGFSADRLIALLNALEVDVDIVIRPHRKVGKRHRGIVRIVGEAAA